MSNVPKLRFSEFSGEWKKEIFKNLVKLQRGSSPRPIVKYVTKSNDGVNWIKIGDTKSNDTYINFTGEKITKEGALKSRRVNIGDIILSNSMSYGKPYILNIDGYIHDGWFVIKEYQNHFNKSYLFQILRSEWIQKQYKRLAAGGVVSNISSELVNAVKINLPLKEEQEKIASFLTSVDTKIEQLTKKESLLQEYKKGVMQKIFNQEIRFKDDDSKLRKGSLKDFGYFYYGKGAPKTSVTKDGKTPCVRYGELYSTYKENIKSIKSYTNVNPKDLKLSKGGEVLVPRVGEDPLDFANCSYLPFPNVAIGEMISVYNTEENGLYLTYYINAMLKKELARFVEGGNVSNLYFRYVEKIEITIPSYEEQTKIVNFLLSIDKKIEVMKTELEKTKEFKKALLQQMFV